jgi:lipopolysaccharide/colanic/teichoic acid biosynthesis glycosyltransferase
MPRHLVKPGMTGWAQVNGLRGNCSIERRIQHDLFYIENWSPWLDLQIMMLTLVRWKNPSE